jgi:hypothetical protein
LQHGPRQLELGGFIIPGYEEYGVVHAHDVLPILPVESELVRSKGEEKFDLGTISELSKTYPSLAPLRDLCPSGEVRGATLIEHRLSLKPESAVDRASTMKTLLESLGVEQNDLDKYVVVAGTLHVRGSVIGCADTASSGRAAEELEELAWAYLPGDFIEGHADVGEQTILKFLSAFDISEMEDRMVSVRSVDSVPSGAWIGWADRMMVGRRDPSIISRNIFHPLGNGPVPGLKLWPGLIYFRIEQSGASYTKSLDVTLDYADRNIVLRVP